MDLETGARAVLTVGVGALVAVLAPLGLRHRAASWAVVALGSLLGFANLLMSAPMVSCASLATAAFVLVLAGAGPQPVVLPTTAASVTPIGAEKAAVTGSNLTAAA
jgi:hypothetical protein